jgi:hypothetical protein
VRSSSCASSLRHRHNSRPREKSRAGAGESRPPPTHSRCAHLAVCRAQGWVGQRLRPGTTWASLNISSLSTLPSRSPPQCRVGRLRPGSRREGSPVGPVSNQTWVPSLTRWTPQRSARAATILSPRRWPRTESPATGGAPGLITSQRTRSSMQRSNVSCSLLARGAELDSLGNQLADHQLQFLQRPARTTEPSSRSTIARARAGPSSSALILYMARTRGCEIP